MKTIKKQQGLSYYAVLILIAMVGAIGLFALKTGPLFMEFESVKSAMDNLAANPNMGKKGKKYMIDFLDKQMYIDDVASVTGEDMTYTRDKKKKVWIVTADYEAKRVLAKNVYVVVHFEKTIEVAR